MIGDPVADGQRVLADRYEIGDPIGRGGMADVYLGTDTRLGRSVAIKILKADLAADPTFRARFRQEAQAASRMSHPTIVRVFDAGEDSSVTADGSVRPRPFIVMEYVEGRTLSSIIKGGPLDPARAIEVTDGILTALEYSHRAGVVHRDIKPANIMITPSGGVKVMDFGIARAVSDTSSSLAQTTAILGTAGYFSPEQAKGETVDARTDLYSTGVVLFEMLTGRVPFMGDTAVAVAYQHVSEPPAMPSTINPAVSPALDLVVAHALTKNRYDRYQTVSEFRADLELAGAGKVPARRPVDDAATALFGPAPTVQTSTEQALRQLTTDTGGVRTQSRPPVAWVWAGVAVIAVVLISVLVWVMSLSGSQGPALNSTQVPDVVGMTQSEAEEALIEANLDPNVTEEDSDDAEAGTVLRTFPVAGIQTERNQVVRVYVSAGAAPVAVPDVANMSEAEARAEIEDAGFSVGSITSSGSPNVPEGTVTGSSPGSGEEVEAGSEIDLEVSDGTVDLGDLVGQTLSAATDTLQGDSMRLTALPIPDPNCPAEDSNPVTAQSESPGSVPQGSTIELTYCSGAPAPVDGDDGDERDQPGGPGGPPSDD